jgi:hypothetical protein
LKIASPVLDKAPHVVELYNLEDKLIKSPLLGDNIKRSIFGGGGFLPVSIYLFGI